MTETIREFLNKHNLNVKRVTWTHLGDDKELDDPVILYDKTILFLIYYMFQQEEMVKY